LTLFELGTLVLIAVVVGLVFRSLVAPLVVLAVVGLGLTFYVPFVAAVLLLALGADSYVFAAAGSGWRPPACLCAKHRPRPADSNRAISTAGIILASTFAMVAIIPLGAFRQLAFIMAVGLLLDTFLVRPVLTPAVLTLLGPAASWPSHRIRTAARDEPT
jgi:RND superfamily putative drug exporter